MVDALNDLFTTTDIISETRRTEGIEMFKRSIPLLALTFTRDNPEFQELARILRSLVHGVVKDEVYYAAYNDLSKKLKSTRRTSHKDVVLSAGITKVCLSLHLSDPRVMDILMPGVTPGLENEDGWTVPSTEFNFMVHRTRDKQSILMRSDWNDEQCEAFRRRTSYLFQRGDGDEREDEEARELSIWYGIIVPELIQLLGAASIGVGFVD
ncbi:hypothetical protein TrRE_jg8087, partial [Triparma retinervis]